MSYITELIAITPDKPLNPKVFEREIKKEMRRHNRQVKKLFESITDQFSYDTLWTQHEKEQGGDLVFEVKTSSTPFVFLGGTTVRHAILSRDYLVRTRKRSFGVGPKRGKVVKVTRQFRGSGIEDREYDKLVADRVEGDFVARVNRALYRAAEKA